MAASDNSIDDSDANQPIKNLNLPEIQVVEDIIDKVDRFARVEKLGVSKEGGLQLPIYKVSYGNPSPDVPVLGLIGGVHGLERIGSQVTLALMSSLSNLILWDKSMQKTLENLRIFFIPTVNPIGILKKRRANPRGVDIMRNAPVDADGEIPFLLGGHRLASWLPWYRGSGGMEPETQFLTNAVKDEVRDSPLALTVDFHSGFGFQDQIWFPYAKTKQPFPDIARMHAFKELLNTTYPNHFYKIEPQAYLTHGDVWDYLYDWYRSVKPSENMYLPLCLEMGSWMWVKKNPLQMMYAEGPFNPIKSHRYKRTLRRHNTFFEFLIRATTSYASWAHLDTDQKIKHELLAQEIWYGG